MYSAICWTDTSLFYLSVAVGIRYWKWHEQSLVCQGTWITADAISNQDYVVISSWVGFTLALRHLPGLSLSFKDTENYDDKSSNYWATYIQNQAFSVMFLFIWKLNRIMLKLSSILSLWIKSQSRSHIKCFFAFNIQHL